MIKKSKILGMIRKYRLVLWRSGGVVARSMGLHEAASRFRKVAVVSVLMLLFVVGTSGAIVGGIRTHDLSQARQAQLDARQVAENAVVQLLSYDASKNLKDDLDRGTELVTGQFATDYRNLIDKVIRPTAEKDNVVTSAKISEGSVVSATADEAVVLLFINQETTSASQKEPRLDSSMVEVTMRLVDGKWLIADLVPL